MDQIVTVNNWDSVIQMLDREDITVLFIEEEESQDVSVTITYREKA